MPRQSRVIKFNNEEIKIVYRSDADLSVIDEIFVDKMYRSVESIIPTLASPILDIGAHIGLFSIYASALNSKVKIIALEPEPTNFELMKENLKANHCQNITAKNLALIPEDNSEKEIKLFLSDDSHNHTTLPPNPLNKSLLDKYITVPATNLTKLIEKNKISLLKIDIEGAEYNIIKSFDKSIFKTIQYIALEYHEFGNKRRADLENIIRQNGFSVEHFPNHYNHRFGLLVCRNRSLLKAS